MPGSIRDRLEGLPTYRTEQMVLDSAHYNRIRLALLRSDATPRIALESLRSLDMLIEEDLWACIDRNLNDVPVIVWEAFQIHGRRGLDTPVPCTVKFYHAHAATIASRVLEATCKTLDERLRDT